MKRKNIYSDGIHLISSISVKHLHQFCKKTGIKRCWYHNGTRHPHYDIPKKMKTHIDNHPDVERVSPKEIVKILKDKKLIKK